MEKFIHIHAKCNGFEIFEQTSEKKSVRRLMNIRDIFIGMQGKGRDMGKLSVRTIVVNPELPFRN